MKRLIGILFLLFSYSAHADAVDDLVAPLMFQYIQPCCDFENAKIYDLRTQSKIPFFFSSVKVKAENVLVVDQLTGAVLYSKNADDIVPIASITKLMTAMVTLDANLDMNEKITITWADKNWLKATHSRLNPGTTLPRHEVLRLALMSSDNRAAHALARTYPEGFDAFVTAMNAKAKSFGMKNTEFYDPTGLTPKNVSTARELVMMVNGAYSYDTIRQFSTTERYQVMLPARKHYKTTLFLNSNRLIHTHQWKIGLSKTGYIKDAGRCVVMQADIEDRPVIIILLDSKTKTSRVKDANTLKGWIENILEHL
jgi:serine-type D-Ala-D-Ala endopeptidase (penicillin-binding protein 7)